MRIEDVNPQDLPHPGIQAIVQERKDNMQEYRRASGHVYVRPELSDILRGAQLYASGSIGDDELFEKVQQEIPFTERKDQISMNLSVQRLQYVAGQLGQDARPIIAAYVLNAAGVDSFEQITIHPNSELPRSQVHDAILDQIFPESETTSASAQDGFVSGVYKGSGALLHTGEHTTVVGGESRKDGLVSMGLHGNPLTRARILDRMMQAASERGWSYLSRKSDEKPLLLGSPQLEMRHRADQYFTKRE